MAKTPQELYMERERRVQDAMRLVLPDRIPIVPDAEFFPLRYAGVTVEEAMYDYDRA
ncbi:MAG: hypothetical protein IBX68_07255, partial [Dehalococcoidia bacterium]|nr:hypothetical protein [Dehalococcoidia bacterium]